MTWVATVDKKSGKTYYYNKETKKTTWTKPEELGGEAKKKKKKKDKSKSKGGDSAAESDPSNWKQVEDPKSGKSYYYNKVTKTTSWKKPPCLADASGSDSDEQPKSKKMKDPADAWSVATDKKTGKQYWYNKVTKKTTWKNPNEKKSKKSKKKAKVSSSDDDSDQSEEEAKPAKKAAVVDSDDDSDQSEEEQDSDDSDSEAKPAKKTASKKVVDSDDSDASSDEGSSKATTTTKRVVDSDDSDDSDDAAKKDDSDEDDDEDDEDDEDEHDGSAATFKFSKHRKGWFNRTFRVGQIHDDAQLLTFKKSGIKKALLKQNRDLDAEAVQAFKNVMSYMGDRKSSKKPIDHAKKMLHNLMLAPAGLRDEVYMQICKQTTRNPRVASTIKGWELMSYCLATFPPSKALKTFLMDYIKKTVKEAKDEKVVELAGVCAARVPKIIKMGQRKQVPSRMELECLKDVKPVPIRVSLVNGTFKSFNVDPYTLVKEVQDQLVEKYNLTVTKPFGMYEAAEANVERILDPKDRILDVQASWENMPKETAVIVEDPKKKSGRHKSGDTKVVMKKAICYNQFLYKAKLVLKTNNQELMSDPEAINLIYIQATHDVVTARYPVNEKDITVLAALQLQATAGDFKSDVHLPGWLSPKIEDYMPRMLLERKGKRSDKLQKEWEQKILAKYAKVSGFTALEAKLNYLEYVQEWTFYGSTFFSVEQRQFKDYPSPLTLGINCEGVILMHPEKQTVLENYGFTDIVTWGHSDEKFIVVVGNIVQQRKLIFKTNEGKAMNHLIHDYVKFKVKNK